jgi:dUTP pyrophosphatase
MKLEVIAHPKLREWGLPCFATDGAAGLDLRAMLNTETSVKKILASGCIYQTYSEWNSDVKSVRLSPGQQIMIDSGLKIHINSRNHVGLLFPRSSTGNKGLVLANGTGVIDSDYQGPLMMPLLNRSNEPIWIEDGERVAQYVLTTAFQFDMQFVNQFSDPSLRGEGGFGSTGSI